jgi:hypothetical protein
MKLIVCSFPSLQLFFSPVETSPFNLPAVVLIVPKTPHQRPGDDVRELGMISIPHSVPPTSSTTAGRPTTKAASPATAPT